MEGAIHFQFHSLEICHNTQHEALRKPLMTSEYWRRKVSSCYHLIISASASVHCMLGLASDIDIVGRGKKATEKNREREGAR